MFRDFTEGWESFVPIIAPVCHLLPSPACSLALQLALAWSCSTKSPNRKTFPCCEIPLPGNIQDSPGYVPTQLALTPELGWMLFGFPLSSISQGLAFSGGEKRVSLWPFPMKKYPKSLYSCTHYYYFALISTETHLLAEPFLSQQPLSHPFL